MDDEELIKEATETPEWEAIPLIDKPLFVRGYITGAKAKLSESDNQCKNLCKAKELINTLLLIADNKVSQMEFQLCIANAKQFLKEELNG